MEHSHSYTYGATPARPPATGPRHRATSGLVPTQSLFNNVEVFTPAEYIGKLSKDNLDESTPPFATAKKPRVEVSPDQRHLRAANLRATTYVTPVTPSTSVSTQYTPSSLTSSADMSRQSSVTSASNASVTGALEMLRFGSFSTASTSDFHFTVDDLDGSVLSSSTEKPATNNVSPIAFDDGNDTMLFSSMGLGSSCPNFSFVEPNYSQNLFAVENQWNTLDTHLPQAPTPDMLRSASQQSISSTSSAETKASERRRKHIANAKQTIAPKSLPGGPKSSNALGVENNVRQLKPQEPGVRRKEAIAKTPYVRPSHPKLQCNLCNKFPKGFRGEHELRRHKDRAHAQRRKVWICVEPAVKTNWWPSRPLGICKQCKQTKQYPMDYNAVAHLRRVHFSPCKRGRKPRGEERESRAGKAGGDWPPIDWLKANGWLVEIEVSHAANDEEAHGTAGRALANGHDDDADDADDDSDELDFVPDIFQMNEMALDQHEEHLAAEVLGFGHVGGVYMPDNVTDFAVGYPTPIDGCVPDTQWQGGMGAAMEHTLSAPAAFHHLGGHYDGIFAPHWDDSVRGTVQGQE